MKWKIKQISFKSFDKKNFQTVFLSRSKSPELLTKQMHSLCTLSALIIVVPRLFIQTKKIPKDTKIFVEKSFKSLTIVMIRFPDILNMLCRGDKIPLEKRQVCTNYCISKLYFSRFTHVTRLLGTPRLFGR